ncbi:BTAD domain-containing putative transcriptional regulator [Amycolatopsis sp. NPDC051106]|uniref:AfsR/SARP family transcriptional regulator n=1 Tax=unclassified Amycolatopsis TaxID=2618356 RepID=UPI00343B16A7
MEARFALLGDFEAWTPEGPVSIPPGHPQAVLALLLIARGRPVQSSALVDDLWEQDDSKQPGKPKNVVHQAIKSLRTALGDTGKTLIVTVGRSAYRLDVPPEATDLHRFDALLQQADEETTAHGRSERLTEALALWRGEPFAGIAAPGLATTRARLVEQHLQALQRYIEAELDLGRHQKILPLVRQWAEREPTREYFCRQLMIALYRSGETTEAVNVYQAFRENLEEQYGAPVTPELKDLHVRISRQDPALMHAGSTSPATRRSAPPRTLPPVTANFVGREAELEQLTRYLRQRREAAGPLVVAIAGPGGMGKTSLALCWGKRHQEEFADGSLYADLRGFDGENEPATAGIVLRRFLEALGVAAEEIPAGTEARSDLFRGLVDDKRLLIVLDNAANTGQVRSLLPAGARCCVLVTSRNQLAGALAGLGAVHLPLDPLPEGAARNLLVRSVGPRADGDPGAVDRLLAVCDGLPLALCLVAGLVQLQPRITLARIAGELEEHRLATLDSASPDSGFRVVMSRSWDVLDARQQRLAGLLALAPGPDIGRSAAGALLSIPTNRVDGELRSLTHASLLEQSPDRYRMHALVRAYLAERCTDALPAADVRLALRQLTRYSLHVADAADHVLHPQRGRIPLVPHTAAPPRFANRGAAIAWFDAEHRCLLDTQRAAAEAGWHEETWQLAWTMHTFHHRRGLTDEHLTSWLRGQQATTHIGDLGQRSLANRLLAGAYTRAGRHERAREHLDAALAFAEQCGDRLAQAQTLQFIAWHSGERGAFPEAEAAAEQALELYRALGDAAGIAQVLNAIGCYATGNRDFCRARRCCEEALLLSREIADRDTEAATLDSLGQLAVATGDFSEAVTHYENAAAMLSELDNAYAEPATRERLGECYLRLGRPSPAIEAWTYAVRLYRRQHRHGKADDLTARLAELTGSP